MVVPKVSLFLLVVALVKCAMVNGPNTEDSFRNCLISQPSVSLGYCIGVGAISKLQSWDSSPEFDLVDGFSLSRDDKQFREDYHFMERDPNDLRSIFDTFGQVLSKRSMKWDMDFLYPGLSLRVAPSTSPGGHLEFFLDPHRELATQHSLKEASTARILTRQFLVPLLLGFKFNIATAIPIIFGLLALIAKKAVVLSKIALIASSAFGLGSLLLGSGYYHHKPHYGSHFNPAFGGHHHPYRQPDEDYSDNYYRVSNNNNDYNDDQLRVYANFKQPVQPYSREEKDQRNFKWGEDEKEGNNT